MKKRNNIFIRFLLSIIKIIDKLVVTPITRLLLKYSDWFKSLVKEFDRLSGNKTFLLVISLILAFASFVIIDKESDIALDQHAEVLYKQPVNAIYNDELYVVDGLPNNVDITLVGQKRHIFLAKQSPSKGVTVDLTGLKPGYHKVRLKYSNRLKSLDYKLDPSEVAITIHKKVSENKSLTYDLLHSDSLNSKLYIDKVTLDRSDVIVKGSQKDIDKVASVRALIDVKEIIKHEVGEVTLKNVPLVAYDTNGKIIKVETVPKTISARIKITSPSKEVPIKIIPTGNVALGKAIKDIESNISKVTIYGKESAVEKLDQIGVKVDVNGINKDKEYNITLEKPNNITELSETQLKVVVKLDNSESRTIKDVRIRTENLSDSFIVNALTSSDSIVDVKVTGSADNIKSITADNIKAYIDLRNVKVGENRVKVKVTGEDLRLNYEIINNKTVTVVVTQK